MKKIIESLIINLASFYIKCVYITTKWKWINKQFVEQNKKPAIFCFWHGRLSMMAFAWNRKDLFYMLLSNHSDGKLVGEIVKKIGNFDLIYGSTSNKNIDKNGANAAISIFKKLKENIPIGITPDGPRGPRFSVSNGIPSIAYLSKCVVVPVSFSVSRKIFLNTWDKFLLPIPFGRGVFIAGKPIEPPNHRSEFESWKTLLAYEMNNITQEADKNV